jgi:DNA repair exonuclease SbcCD ATPase subunit
LDTAELEAAQARAVEAERQAAEARRQAEEAERRAAAANERFDRFQQRRIAEAQEAAARASEAARISSLEAEARRPLCSASSAGEGALDATARPHTPAAGLAAWRKPGPSLTGPSNLGADAE